MVASKFFSLVFMVFVGFILCSFSIIRWPLFPVCGYVVKTENLNSLNSLKVCSG